ncbi:MAG: hypothetical protein DRR19_07950 [Candidatus Parabeggiatoa sp. nov. 1]|nr:MAG: hypothetical protein DRR19_07950 [Gammaproteobacteria bacterium]
MPQVKLQFYPNRNKVQEVGWHLFLAPYLIQVQTPVASMGWNKYYSDIARYEPSYEQLNDILKWSQLLGWLEKTQQRDLLQFLADVPVNRTHWFPQWVTEDTQTSRLKFNQWNKIAFFEKGAKGIQTEALPLLTTSLVGGIQDSESGIENQASVDPEQIGLNLEKMLEHLPNTEIVGKLGDKAYTVKMTGNDDWLTLSLVLTSEAHYGLQQEWREESVLFKDIDEYTVIVEPTQDGSGNSWKIIAYRSGINGKPIVLTGLDEDGNRFELTGRVDNNGIIHIWVAKGQPNTSPIHPSDLKSRLKRFDVNNIRQQAADGSRKQIRYELETPSSERDFKTFLNDLEQEKYAEAANYIKINKKQARRLLARHLVDEYAKLINKFFLKPDYEMAAQHVERLKKIYGELSELLLYQNIIALRNNFLSPKQFHELLNDPEILELLRSIDLTS